MILDTEAIGSVFGIYGSKETANNGYEVTAAHLWQIIKNHKK
jgi:hypothetical protein